MNTELIELFFQKQCTAEEAEEVAAYLKANPALLEKYVSIHEWNTIAGSDMPEKFWSEVWLNIQKKIKAKIISVKLKRIAVAACLILMIGAVYYYLIPEKQVIKTVARLDTLPKAQPKTITNLTDKIKTTVLEDSSVVQLSPHSSIQYDFSFSKNKREIFLEGEAKFTVAKNKKKPFTVYTGMLATTALGTIFTVNTKDNKNITVKLFRGKVLIQAEDKNLKGWNKDVYLLPGEQLKFNADRMLLSVEKINTINKNDAARTKKPIADSLISTLNFSSTALPLVMQKLSAYYNVKIQYDSVLIDSMNFTGTVTKNDSLPVILKAISQMNNLDITKTENDFIISKHQQSQ